MSTDPQSLLLENIATGLASGAHMEDILAQMGDTDPRLGLIAKYLANRRATADEVDDEEDGVEPDYEKPKRPRCAESSTVSRERAEAIRSLQRLARTMFAELEELRLRNDKLASALGACYLCWGDDPQCEVCNGEGVPGSFAPDKQLFSRLIGPALRRLRNPTAHPSGISTSEPRRATERTN